MQVALIVPGGLDARTGGSIYDRHIADGLRALGWTVDILGIDALASLADDSVAVVDGLAYGTAPQAIDQHAARLRLIALVHLPLGLEVGLEPAEADRLRALECRVLATVKHVVVTGERTVDWLGQQGVARSRIALVEPGTVRGARVRTRALGHFPDDPVRLLSVGAITAGKGHEAVVRALAPLRSLNWALACAGSVTRDPATAARVFGLIEEHRLVDRIALLGELDDAQLAAAYDGADVFVLATLRETYGMAVAEAIARGLPVVSTNTGAIPQVVGQGGILVAPGDDAALAAALARVVRDVSYRRQLAGAAWDQRERLPTWTTAARKMADVLEAVAYA